MTTTQTKKTILITGCSDGGLGSELALAFHAAGYRVFATARNTAKLTATSAVGIESLTLDPTSPESIAACVKQVSALTGDGSLDILLNNAGISYSMPVLDMDLNEVRKMFEINTFAIVAMVQGFMPLLEKSRHGGTIVTNTSLASTLPLPLSSMYAASKAATAFLLDALRIELSPFNIKVIELKTGGVKSRIFGNAAGQSLPANSRYMPAKEGIEKSMGGMEMRERFVEAGVWARQVVGDLDVAKPPDYVWRGYSVWLARVLEWMPRGLLDGFKGRSVGLGGLKGRVAADKKEL